MAATAIQGSRLSQTGDSIDNGFQNSPEISHYWGQYSPFFSVPSNISTDIPPTCSLTLAQILSRHGARDPTASKTATYSALISRIKNSVSPAFFTGNYTFLNNYTYTLGADQLTTFGQQEMINSGIKFFTRYEALTASTIPFFRSSSEARVVESALNFTQGYHLAHTNHTARKDPAYPYPLIIISEATGSNNTLNHDLCTAFETGIDSTIASSALKINLVTFAPAIATRLNTALPGSNLTSSEVISFMDLCPFETVASTTGTLSPFCRLFTHAEWRAYNYYNTLNKYYGYGLGNPLGPTQGVGFVNELIARLTSRPVHDHTSTNSTLDSDPLTFPLGKSLYADFSHDNDMTSISSALGLYNDTAPLSNTTITDADEVGGYSAAWTVPFAARIYVEKLRCEGRREEVVRVIVNDRVMPLRGLGADERGFVALGRFVEGLGFARMGGFWGMCFV